MNRGVKEIHSHLRWREEKRKMVKSQWETHSSHKKIYISEVNAKIAWGVGVHLGYVCV